jgi:hypothetical protein
MLLPEPVVTKASGLSEHWLAGQFIAQIDMEEVPRLIQRCVYYPVLNDMFLSALTSGVSP